MGAADISESTIDFRFLFLWPKFDNHTRRPGVNNWAESGSRKVENQAAWSLTPLQQLQSSSPSAMILHKPDHRRPRASQRWCRHWCVRFAPKNLACVEGDASLKQQQRHLCSRYVLQWLLPIHLLTILCVSSFKEIHGGFLFLPKSITTCFLSNFPIKPWW